MELLNVADAGVNNFALGDFYKRASRNPGGLRNLRPTEFVLQQALNNVLVHVVFHAESMDPNMGFVNPQKGPPGK